MAYMCIGYGKKEEERQTEIENVAVEYAGDDTSTGLFHTYC